MSLLRNILSLPGRLKDVLSLPRRMNDMHTDIRELRKEYAMLQQSMEMLRGDITTQFGFLSNDIEKTLVASLAGTKENAKK